VYPAQAGNDLSVCEEYFMKALARLKPKFWDHRDVAAGPYKHLFNFRRIWKMAVILTAGVTLLPVLILAVIDYNVTRRSEEREIHLRTFRLVSNARRTIAFFLEERKSAVDFIVRDNTFEALNTPSRLAGILENLKEAFGGGFVDLGIIDPLGYQRTYVGPYDLKEKDYSDQGWYKEVLERGVYVSDVFMGFRHMPHLVVAVRCRSGGGLYYVIRATLDMQRFNDLLSQLEMSGMGDAFIINRDGILQTPSRLRGNVLDRISLPVPQYSHSTEVFEANNPEDSPLIIGYAYIEGTPFILMIVEKKAELMNAWYRTRMTLVGFAVASVILILFVILGVATHLVNNMHEADQKRVMTLHQVEYSNKMATIGRLAAGVAHEINNPLAIINEKVGLIKDMVTIKGQCAKDEKLVMLADSVVASVDRCATIARRLLRFSRSGEINIRVIDLKETILEVLGFLGKEAEYRSIKISVDVPEKLPEIESDASRLQEIFLNIINNAFAAVDDGGRLDISVGREGEFVRVAFTDDGCGIPEQDLDRVFEPFFSTKAKRGGTGLGLSITSGLVQELGGRISVQSKVGEGTSFIVLLPFKIDKKREGDGNARAAG
jgi:two-component system, NtrC family, sensor kinase